MKSRHHSSLLWLLIIKCFIIVVHSAASLPRDEVNALRQISRRLGKNDWNFRVDPCTGQSGWTTPDPEDGFENAVTCNCTFQNGTICHVVSIVLKSQNLAGVLPREMARLPYIIEIDLSRNYLSGPIPFEWESLPLVNISVLGNRLSGPLPKELGNISTLRDIVLEANRFSGPLPSELGNLVNVERMLLSSNEFTGDLPESLANLTKLRDFRINDNNFSGKVPSFIRNWIQLHKIALQGSGLKGPIPYGISFLTNLTDMRISDIGGPPYTFPPIDSLTEMKTLILRNCNLEGEIPEYLGELRRLKTLDISFNKLTGRIPSNFINLQKSDFMYLTNNLLTGLVPDWMLTRGENIDLSYNNFTSSTSCQVKNVNLFGQNSAVNSSIREIPCMQDFQCTRYKYSLYINCGGKGVISSDILYDADERNGAPSIFFTNNNNWAVISTGHFMDNDVDIDSYIVANTSAVSMNDSELYQTARISPISLTYYAMCLLNGNYTVNLHFAEIIFKGDQTYCSLGKRIFNVYIQRKLVAKDFNIEDQAGGAGKAVVNKFKTTVINNTLEIRLIWSGKGTTAIPVRGTYGPLISAISVTPDFKPPREGNKKLHPAYVVAIVVGALSIVLAVLFILWCKGCLRTENRKESELKVSDLQTGSFSLRQIKVATNNFDFANKIGEGGFGPVYKGLLSDGTIIAVKQLSARSKQGNREFVNEIGMISAVQHPNLVRLYGCCIEGNQLLLVYEYMENNSLARALWGPDGRLKLDWFTRCKICLGIAKGLAYLHEESALKIVHRDIKTTNILLDKVLNPKISDFGLAKLSEEDDARIITRVAGTIGYMAPEYAMRGYLTAKADVYSFGVVVLEIISGKSNSSYKPKEDCVFLLDWVYVLRERGTLMELIDPELRNYFDKEEAMMMINVALLCINASPSLRPRMTAVVGMLEGRASVDEAVSKSHLSYQQMKLRAIANNHLLSQTDSESEGQTMSSQTECMSMGDPWTVSSFSDTDLFHMNSHSYVTNVL